jgi:hypothetical protein
MTAGPSRYSVNGTPFPRYATITKPIESDYAAIDADLSL